MSFRMESEIQPAVPLRLKIEINCFEHFNVLGLVTMGGLVPCSSDDPDPFQYQRGQQGGQDAVHRQAEAGEGTVFWASAHGGGRADRVGSRSHRKALRHRAVHMNPSQHFETGGCPEEPYANHNRCGQCRDAAQGFGHFYRDRGRDRFGRQRYDDFLRSSRPFGNQGNRYDADRATGHLAHEDRDDLFPDRFQLQVERNAQSHHGGLEPEVDDLPGFLIGLVADAGQLQENDEQHDADQNRIEQQPSGLFLQDFG